MGRRKKELPVAHREKISLAASKLFLQKGIAATSMDDVAKAAGYSKATLYVYFENKDDLVGLLVLESMKKLRDYISEGLQSGKYTREKYDGICTGLMRYQREYPLYFQLALDKIDASPDGVLPEEEDTYRVGEEINAILADFITEGIKNGEFRAGIHPLATIFNFWGMLSGVIQLAQNKSEYILSAMGMNSEEFLGCGFDMLYRSIKA